MPTLVQPQFNTITETPGGLATKDQLCILHTRYDLAARMAAGKDVLEVACGPGVGLALIARTARSVVGGDIDERNLGLAKTTNAKDSRISVVKLDAEELPYSNASFDLVILYEALYYLPDIDRFFREAKRVLRPNGCLLISTVNCRWDEFNPSPFSVKYLDADELSATYHKHGFGVEILAGFQAGSRGWRSLVRGVARKVAISLHLIPKTMKGKEWLKRLFYGRLQPIPFL